MANVNQEFLGVATSLVRAFVLTPMGFSLQISSLADGLDEDEGSRLRTLLQSRGVSWNDEIDVSHFEGKDPFETEVYLEGENDEVERPEICHWEVGWSWWSHTQKLLAQTLGAENVPTAFHIHAWYGVAVPGEIENTMLGEPTARQEPKMKTPSIFSGIFGSKKSEHDEHVAQQIEYMVWNYAGPYENLMVVSSPRLLREMDAAIQALGLSDAEMRGRYDAIEDVDDPMETGKCYLLMTRAFLRVAVEHRHLCWWRK